MKKLKAMLIAALLIAVATPLAPTASAATCVGHGLGGEVAQACNEALGTAGGAADTAEGLAQKVIRCLTGAHASAAFYCVHT